MTLIVATIPEDGAELPGWLERQLVGLNLRRLVAELLAVHQPSPHEQTSVEVVLKEHLDRVYSEGLRAVPRPLLRDLLTHPLLLLQLQQLVLENGGPYWDNLSAADAAVTAHVERGRQRLIGSLRLAAEVPPPRLPWYRQAWFASLATVAALLLAVAAWEWLRPAPSQRAVGWGWDRPGRCLRTSPARSTSRHWPGRPRSGSTRSRRRPRSWRGGSEMRQGCSTLLLSEHAPLPEEDRRWLRRRCRKWASAFDEQLAQLEEGKKDVSAVREAVGQTVRKLVTALQERAKAA